MNAITSTKILMCKGQSEGDKSGQHPSSSSWRGCRVSARFPKGLPMREHCLLSHFGVQQALPHWEEQPVLTCTSSLTSFQRISFMLIEGDAGLFLLVYFSLLVCRVFFVNLPYLFKC